MNSFQFAVNTLICKARGLSNNFHEMLSKCTVLVADSQNVDQKLVDCRGVQEDQLLKNLVKYCNDEERIHHLLINAELKQTVEMYKAGVEHLMEKYRQHSQGNILKEHSDLRAKYVAGLQKIVNSLDRRIEEMTVLMILAVGLEEQNGNDNQRIIRQLSKENELMRQQLQISSKCNERNSFKQGLPACTESSTQIEDGDDYETDSDSTSSDSFHSFVTCFSSSPGVQSVVDLTPNQ